MVQLYKLWRELFFGEFRLTFAKFATHLSKLNISLLMSLRNNIACFFYVCFLNNCVLWTYASEKLGWLYNKTDELLTPVLENMKKRKEVRFSLIFWSFFQKYCFLFENETLLTLLKGILHFVSSVVRLKIGRTIQSEWKQPTQ